MLYVLLRHATPVFETRGKFLEYPATFVYVDVFGTLHEVAHELFDCEHCDLFYKRLVTLLVPIVARVYKSVPHTISVSPMAFV